MNYITQRVVAGLKAQGVSATVIWKGHLAKIGTGDSEKMVTEELFVYRDKPGASNAELIGGLVQSIMSKSKGRRSATLREVNTQHLVDKSLAHTCAGFL